MSQFRRWSVVDQWRAVDNVCDTAARYAAGEIVKARLTELEFVIGLNSNPDGVLASHALRQCGDAIDAVTYDWVHNMVQGGVFTTECEALLKASIPHGITRPMIFEILGDNGWRFPRFTRTKAAQLYRIFDVRRHSKDRPDKVKASCSEMLGVYGLLRVFFETKLMDVPELDQHVKSFTAVCRVMDLLLEAKRHEMPIAVVADMLDVAAADFMRLHQAVYGTSHITPKHHWQLDIAAQFRRDGIVLDAFVIERSHLTVKAVAKHVRNTACFETSVIASVLVVQLQQAKAGHGYMSDLIGITGEFPNTEFTIADRMTIWTFEVSVDDVVRRHVGDPARVVACAKHSNGTLCCFVSLFESDAVVTDHSGKYRDTGTMAVWDATSLRLCIAWRHQPDGCVFVVR